MVTILSTCNGYDKLYFNAHYCEASIVYIRYVSPSYAYIIKYRYALPLRRFSAILLTSRHRLNGTAAK